MVFKNLKVVIISVFLSLICINIVPLGAAKGTTTVTYERKETVSYLLTVSVKGEGAVYDGSEMIRDQISEYQLKIDSFKTFRIHPNEGENLEKITLDGVDVTQRIQNNLIKIEGKEVDQTLIFYFSEGQVAGVDNDQNVTKPTKPSKTDDETVYFNYILGILSSILFMAIVYKKGKERGFSHCE